MRREGIGHDAQHAATMLLVVENLGAGGLFQLGDYPALNEEARGHEIVAGNKEVLNWIDGQGPEVGALELPATGAIS